MVFCVLVLGLLLCVGLNRAGANFNLDRGSAKNVAKSAVEFGKNKAPGLLRNVKTGAVSVHGVVQDAAYKYSRGESISQSLKNAVLDKTVQKVADNLREKYGRKMLYFNTYG